MALFQPSNVIPSTFAGEGLYTVDATQPIKISWQVNGNSPMTAFQIKIYNNLTTEELHDTGITPIVGSPFYGVDEKGNPQQFIYSLDDTWTDWGISNGLECYMVISQWWGSDITASSTTQITQWSGSVFYTKQTPSLNIFPTLQYDEVCYQIQQKTSIPKSALQNGGYIDFSKINSISNSRKVYFIPIQRSTMTCYFPINENYQYVYYSSNTISSSSKTNIARSDASFTPIEGAIDLTEYFDLSNVTQIPIYYTPQVSASGTFLIDNIDSNNLIKGVRWKTSAFKLYNPLRNIYNLNLIEDTGVINTQQLSYENNVYQRNAFHQIECEVIDQYGNTTVVDRFGNRVNSTGFIFMVYTPVAEEITSSYCNNKSDGSITVNIISSLSNISNIAFYEEGEIINKFLYLGNYSDLTQVKFYSFRSGNPINLLIYGLNSNNAYNNSGSVACENYQLNSYYLYEATQDETYPNVYHVLNSWRFGNNISVGSLSNNNNPNWLTNFTPYRLRQPSSRLGESGTLQALLSNYNQSQNFYQDTVAMMQSLKQASVSNNTFFLKDIKGNLYMVGISGPITQTINTKSQVQEVKISISWEEIGDASNISLIQLPTDSGWGNNTEN